MSDHLPECDFPNAMGCICPELRACEVRVWQSSHAEEDALIRIVTKDALDAARDAVAASIGPASNGPFDATVLARALSAIDALRNK